jgi:hypothetical protein
MYNILNFNKLHCVSMLMLLPNSYKNGVTVLCTVLGKFAEYRVVFGP